MNPQEYQHIASLVQRALELRPEARAAFLDEAAGDSDTLRAEVDKLLRQQTTGWLDESPAIVHDVGLADTPPLPERIGPYQILGLLGRGGFGEVYLAQQVQPVQRRIAVKVVRHDMDTAEVLSRFEAERQTLAMLSHPNIAKLYDAGTTEDGRPYFVMEYISGRPLNTYCDQERLSIDDRLTIFRRVCDAVHHANTAGVIHRDLKPSNVLVDGSGNPTVIDFGIARALRAVDHASLTRQGQHIGTPEYMSPEQVEMAGRDLDARTDVYALGVILYELLTGMLPFDSRPDGTDREPPTPSARMGSLDQTQAAAIASRRKTSARALTARFRRCLESIPLKALHQDRALRYATVAELADDIDRYLKGQRPFAAAGQRRRHVLAPAVGIVLVMCALVGVWMAGKILRHAGDDVAPDPTGQAILVRAIRQMATEDVHLAGLLARELPDNQTALPFWEAHRLLGRPPLESRVFTDHASPVYEVAFSPDGSRFASASDSRIVIQSMAEDSEPIVLEGHSTRRIAWGPNGSLLASSWFDPEARIHGAKIWRVDDSTESVVLSGHTNVVRDLTWSRDGDRLVTASMDGTARLWDAASGQELRVLARHEGGVWSARLDPRGDRIATSGGDARIVIQSLDVEAEPRVILHASNIGCGRLRWIPDGSGITGATISTTPSIWRTDASSQVVHLPGHNAGTTHIEWSCDGTLIFTASTNATAHIATNGGRVVSLVGHTDNVYDVAWNPVGSELVTVSDDGRGIVWQATDEGDYGAAFTFSHVADVQSWHALWSVDWRSDGAAFVTGGSEGASAVWQTNWPSLRRTLWERPDAILTVDQRTTYLGESLAEATARYEAQLARLRHDG